MCVSCGTACRARNVHKAPGSPAVTSAVVCISRAICSVSRTACVGARRSRRWRICRPKRRSTRAGGWKLLPNERPVRFNEMEFHLPLANQMQALREVIDAIEEHRPDVFTPIEVRVIRPDDAWLSPFQNRLSGSIAVHAWYKDDCQFFYDPIAPIRAGMTDVRTGASSIRSRKRTLLRWLRTGAAPWRCAASSTQKEDFSTTISGR